MPYSFLEADTLLLKKGKMREEKKGKMKERRVIEIDDDATTILSFNQARIQNLLPPPHRVERNSIYEIEADAQEFAAAPPSFQMQRCSVNVDGVGIRDESDIEGSNEMCFEEWDTGDMSKEEFYEMVRGLDSTELSDLRELERAESPSQIKVLLDRLALEEAQTAILPQNARRRKSSKIPTVPGHLPHYVAWHEILKRQEEGLIPAILQKKQWERDMDYFTRAASLLSTRKSGKLDFDNKAYKEAAERQRRAARKEKEKGLKGVETSGSGLAEASNGVETSGNELAEAPKGVDTSGNGLAAAPEGVEASGSGLADPSKGVESSDPELAVDTDAAKGEMIDLTMTDDEAEPENIISQNSAGKAKAIAADTTSTPIPRRKLSKKARMARGREEAVRNSNDLVGNASAAEVISTAPEVESKKRKRMEPDEEEEEESGFPVRDPFGSVFGEIRKRGKRARAANAGTGRKNAGGS